MTIVSDDCEWGETLPLHPLTRNVGWWLWMKVCMYMNMDEMDVWCREPPGIDKRVLFLIKSRPVQMKMKTSNTTYLDVKRWGFFHCTSGCAHSAYFPRRLGTQLLEMYAVHHESKLICSGCTFTLFCHGQRRWRDFWQYDCTLEKSWTHDHPDSS